MFWPRVTVAAALATLIVLVPAIWWNQSHPTAAPEETLAKAPAVSATEATVNLADNRQIKIEPAATPASEAGALASSTRVLEGRAATEFSSPVTKGFSDKEIAAAKIQSAPAAAPVAGTDSKAKSDTMAGAAPPVAQSSSAGSVGTKQQFSQQLAVQSFRNNAQQVSRPANVLNTFQVQQEGSEIRVLDADGSTYTGTIEQRAKSAELDSRISARHSVAKQTRRHDSQAAGESESAAPQSYFRATGFNVSLKKKLVFEGNYAAPPAPLPAKATSNDRERAESSSDRARIVGTVRVDGEAPVEVDAIAETPEAAATKKGEN